MADGSLVVHAAGVSRTYVTKELTVTALHPVDVDVRRAEMVAVLGPSGSGKTTLLNIIAGLDRPTAGSVSVLDTDITSLKEHQRTDFRAEHIGLVFQDPHLLRGFTALENVVIGRLPRGGRRDLEARARDLLKELGLGARLDFTPELLSGGERQRVGIARALLGDPQLLLADEPTGNLDRASTAAFLEVLQQLTVSRDLAVLVATHDAFVASAAGCVVQLDSGAGSDA